MRTAAYFTYIPKRIRTADEIVNRVRNFIYAFKNGKRKATDYAISLVANTLNKWYGASCEDYVLCCVPSANNYKYIVRFKRFAEQVSKLTGVQNGTAHVNSLGSVKPSTPTHDTS